MGGRRQGGVGERRGAEAQAGSSVKFQNRDTWQEWGEKGPEEASLGAAFMGE